MIDLHPKILEFEGKKAFVVLTYEEFMEIEEQLHELEDIKALRKAKALEGNAATVSLSELRSSYDVEDAEE